MPQEIQQLANGDILHLLPGGGSIRWTKPDPNVLGAQTTQYVSDNRLKEAQLNAEAAKAQAQSQAAGQMAMAGAQKAGAVAAPYAAYAPSAANMYGSYAGLLGQGVGTFGQMFDSYSKAFQGYGNAIGNIAGNAAMAQANANADRYSSYAQGNTGYQNMLGALGASALGAYGSASNAAMQAQAARETAAMKMMADAAAANQAATASYGGQQAAALAGLGNAYANAATGLGSARAGIARAGSDLGVAGVAAMANVAGNAMNYTRDMGKLDLARTLGIGQINAMSGGGFPGGTMSLSGPGGSIASGAYGGYFGGGGSVPQMPQTPGWYSSPQYYDGGGKQGILDALSQGNQRIDAQAAGMNSDSSRTFGGLDETRNRAADPGILNSLNNNYASSWKDMLNMYQQGRQDPGQLLSSILEGTKSLTQPFLSAGKDAYGQFLGNFPTPLQQTPGSFQDPSPYLKALQDGWNPFMSGLDRTLGMQNSNVLGALMSGGSAYGAGVNDLANNMRWSTQQVQGGPAAYMTQPTPVPYQTRPRPIPQRTR